MVGSRILPGIGVKCNRPDITVHLSQTSNHRSITSYSNTRWRDRRQTVQNTFQDTGFSTGWNCTSSISTKSQLERTLNFSSNRLFQDLDTFINHTGTHSALIGISTNITNTLGVTSSGGSSISSRNDGRQ